jgi:hypothetical protein
MDSEHPTTFSSPLAKDDRPVLESAAEVLAWTLSQVNDSEEPKMCSIWCWTLYRHLLVAAILGQDERLLPYGVSTCMFNVVVKMEKIGRLSPVGPDLGTLKRDLESLSTEGLLKGVWERDCDLSRKRAEFYGLKAEAQHVLGGAIVDGWKQLQGIPATELEKGVVHPPGRYSSGLSVTGTLVGIERHLRQTLPTDCWELVATRVQDIFGDLVS